MRYLILTLVLLSLVMLSLGCVTKEQVEKAEQAATQVVDEGEILFDEMKTERDAALIRADQATADGAEDRARAERQLAATLDARIADVQKGLTVAVALRDELRDELANWQGPGDMFEAAGRVLLPFLPAPAQAPGVLVLGVGGMLARLFNRSSALKSLASSVVKLSNDNPPVSVAIIADSHKLRSIQTKSAQRAIDAAQGKRSALPV